MFPVLCTFKSDLCDKKNIAEFEILMSDRVALTFGVPGM
jgi:hypothetical protein